ncbi:MAG: hypothetical protein HF982_03610 [Desulfobacteraceae bacterium]|nr:hypothetical protein [Desulfobacteraceae bacterium]MBC2718673.1 aspartyl protease family protein [Desulfobacteraceae bacterium]
MNRFFLSTTMLIGVILAVSGCTTFKAISVMNGGRPISGNVQSSEIPFKIKGEHMIIVPVKINNSDKQYNFMLDTGAITVVSKKIATKLNLPFGVEIVARDSTGGTKQMQLINLDSLQLGEMIVAECATGILDFSEVGGKLKNRNLEMDIDGLLGSNFLRYFKVIIDYKNKKLHLSNEMKPTVTKDGGYKIKFTTNMQMGYAPRIECTIDNNTKAYGIIDTGAPFLATLPLSLVEKTDAYKFRQVVKAKGNVWGAAFKASENNSLLRVKNLKMGALVINEIPVISLPHKHILIGKKFLSKFLVTLDYPSQMMTLTPYDKLDFASNIYSFGTIVNKDKEGKTVIVGFWEGSSADKIGVEIGDELVMINDKNINELSPIEVENIYYNDNINEIEVVYRNKSGLHKVKATKEMLLPPL